MNNRSSYDLRAQYYDIEFGDTNDQLILESLAAQARGKILEIPCGSGRNCFWLSKLNIPTVFGDINQKMIDEVNCKLNTLDISHKAVARKLDIVKFSSKEPFDLILVPREGFQIFRKDTASKILQNFSVNLNNDGRVYLDLANLDIGKVENPQLLPKYIFEQNSSYHLDINHQKDDLTFMRWHKSELRNRLLYISFRFLIVKESERSEFSTHLTLQQYTFTEIEQMANLNGLHIEKTYGGYDMKQLSSSSERMIFILRSN